MEKKNILLLVAAIAIGTVLVGLACSLLGQLLKWALGLLAVAGVIWLAGYLVCGVDLVGCVAGQIRSVKEKRQDGSQEPPVQQTVNDQNA